jgi:hypothetical protein
LPEDKATTENEKLDIDDNLGKNFLTEWPEGKFLRKLVMQNKHFVKHDVVWDYFVNVKHEGIFIATFGGICPPKFMCWKLYSKVIC